jgi:hypothetical protein
MESTQLPQPGRKQIIRLRILLYPISAFNEAAQESRVCQLVTNRTRSSLEYRGLGFGVTAGSHHWVCSLQFALALDSTRMERSKASLLMTLEKKGPPPRTMSIGY